MGDGDEEGRGVSVGRAVGEGVGVSVAGMEVGVMGVTPTQLAESKLVTNKIAIKDSGENPLDRYCMRKVPGVKHTGKRFEWQENQANFPLMHLEPSSLISLPES